MPLVPSVLPMGVSTSLDTNGNRGTSVPHPKAAIRHKSVPTSIARILRCAPTPLQAAKTYPAPKGGAHRLTDSLFRRKPIVPERRAGEEAVVRTLSCPHLTAPRVGAHVGPGTLHTNGVGGGTAGPPGVPRAGVL